MMQKQVFICLSTFLTAPPSWGGDPPCLPASRGFVLINPLGEDSVDGRAVIIFNSKVNQIIGNTKC